jgi:DNA-binding NtrC family response regulator
MVCVNCSALPEALLEAELFGHVKGAFTGATNHRMGRFEEANHGTIFLDEIGDLPLSLQAKLLRVLQEREFQRLGSSATIHLDVRVIAATHTSLTELIQQGKFREDLYYRLNVVPILVPPLREHASDIRALVGHFIEKICRGEEIPVKLISRETLDRLSAHDWPGNVRQLENTIFRAVVLCDTDALDVVDFPQIATAMGVSPREREHMPEGAPAAVRSVAGVALAPPRMSSPYVIGAVDAAGHMRKLEDLEAEIIRMAIARYEGRMSEIARRLGIGRSTLYRKLKEFGLDEGADASSDDESTDVPRAANV